MVERVRAGGDALGPLAEFLATRFAALPADCGNEAVPGTDESPRNRDWSARPTTRDQARIEEVIAPLLMPQSRLLHVGIGNSGLARRFCGQVAQVDGVTISHAEIEQANSLHLPNYIVRLLNKYGRDFATLIGPYDFILDNNPTTFACCRAHFARMMQTYAAMLALGGILVTDKAGLKHLASDNSTLARWSFSSADWLSLAQVMGLACERHGETVLILRRR